MAGSDQDGADQSSLEEGARSTGDETQVEAHRENATGDPNQKQETSSAENTQRSIRDMLDDEGEASVFVNRNLVEPDTIIDEERIVGRDDQLESVVSFLKPTLQGNRPPNMLLYGPAGTGKSLIIGAVTQQIVDLSQSKGEQFGVVDINCQPINMLR